MSRSGYVYCEPESTGDFLRMHGYRQAVRNAINGKRGQAFFKELIEALDAMPIKELIEMHDDETGDAVADGCNVCALGAIGLKRGFDVIALSDTSDVYDFLNNLDIADALRTETVFMNDEMYDDCDPSTRWKMIRAWAVRNLKEEK
jgi:hypothetical protein